MSKIAALPRAYRPVLPRGASEPDRLETPEQIAAVLAAASAINARRFAVAMHERACAGHDDHRLEFWTQVLRHLDP